MRQRGAADFFGAAHCAITCDIAKSQERQALISYQQPSSRRSAMLSDASLATESTTTSASARSRQSKDLQESGRRGRSCGIGGEPRPISMSSTSPSGHCFILNLRLRRRENNEYQSLVQLYKALCEAGGSKNPGGRGSGIRAMISVHQRTAIRRHSSTPTAGNTVSKYR